MSILNPTVGLNAINNLNAEWDKTILSKTITQLLALELQEKKLGSFIQCLAQKLAKVFQENVIPENIKPMFSIERQYKQKGETDARIYIECIIKINQQIIMVEFHPGNTDAYGVSWFKNGLRHIVLSASAEAANQALEQAITEIAKAGNFEQELKQARTRAAAIVEPAQPAPQTPTVRAAKP